MTLAALFVSSLAMAQMPYNPDSNGDNMVGSTDLLSFLSFYGNELIQSDLTCDYEGTEVEQLIVGAITGAIQIDSVYVEYLILDTLEYYTPGCPELIVEPLALERSYTVYPSYFVVDEINQLDTELLSFYRQVTFRYLADQNSFYIGINDWEVNNSLPNWYGSSSSPSEQLPFPEDWVLDEDGIHVPWVSNGWTANCENFRLIPFWSVAE